MKIKIGDTIYDDNEHPIMLILTSTDKRSISQMPIGSFKYMSHPGQFTNRNELETWANVEPQ